MSREKTIDALARMIAMHEGAARILEPGELFSRDWTAVFEKGETGQTLEYVPSRGFYEKAEQFYDLWITMEQMTR